MFDVGSIVASIKADVSGFKAGIDSVKSEVSKLGSTNGTLQDMGASLAGYARTGVLAFGAAAAAATAFSVKSAADFEQASIAFTTMLGSAEKAKSLMKDISDFAAKTPFELPDLVKASKQLLAFGVEQENILPKLRMLGDIASGVGVPVGQLGYVYGQVRIAGKLMGQDLLQFTNAGVPLLDQLAKQMGKTASQIKEDMEKGVGPTFQDVDKALQSMAGEGGKFFNLMDNQSKSFSGILSNLSDNFGRIGRQIVGINEDGTIASGGIFARLKDAAQSFLGWLDANKGAIIGAFQGIINVVSNLVNWIVEHKNIVLILAGAIGAVLIAAITAYTIAMIQAGIATLVATWPLLLIGAAIAALIIYWDDIVAAVVNAATWISSQVAIIVAWFKKIPDAVVNFIGMIPYYIGYFLGWAVRMIKEHWDIALLVTLGPLAYLAAQVYKHWDDIKNFIGNAISGAIEFIRNLPEAASAFFSSIPDRIRAWWEASRNNSKETGRQMLDGFKEFLNNIPEAATQAFRNAIDRVKNIWNDAYNSAKNFGGKLWQGFKDGMGIHSPSYIEKALMAVDDQMAATSQNIGQSVTSLNNNAMGISPGVAEPFSQAGQTSAKSGPSIQYNISVGAFLGTAQEIRTFAERINLEQQRLSNALGQGA